VGLFTSSAGSLACTSCPVGYSTSATGADSVSLCVPLTQQVVVSISLQAAPEAFYDYFVRQNVLAAVASALGVSALQVTAAWPTTSRVLERWQGLRAVATTVTFTVNVDAASAERIKARRASDIKASLNIELTSRSLPQVGGVSLASSSGTEASNRDPSGMDLGLIAGCAGGAGAVLLTTVCIFLVLRAKKLCCWRLPENRPNEPIFPTVAPEPLNVLAQTSENSHLNFTRKDEKIACLASAPPMQPLAVIVEPIAALGEAQSAVTNWSIGAGSAVTTVPVTKESQLGTFPCKMEPAATQMINFEFVEAVSTVSIKPNKEDQSRSMNAAIRILLAESAATASSAEILNNKVVPPDDASIKVDAGSSMDSPSGTLIKTESTDAGVKRIKIRYCSENITKKETANVHFEKIEDAPLGVAGLAMTQEPAAVAPYSIKDCPEHDDPPSAPPAPDSSAEFSCFTCPNHAPSAPPAPVSEGSKAEKSFCSSHFKEIYGKSKLPQNEAKLLSSVDDFLTAVARSRQLSDFSVQKFLDNLHDECMGVSEGSDPSGVLMKKRFVECKHVPAFAQRLWTCTSQLEELSSLEGRELCYYINDALRRDDKMLLAEIMVHT